MSFSLIPARAELFFSKNDPHDPRLGERVLRALPENASDLVAQADVVLVGAPEDRGVVANGGREGARLGPDAIRRSLYRLTPGFGEDLNRLVLVDLGNIPVEGRSLEEVHEDLRHTVAEVARSEALPLVLGGGHDLSFPALAGLGEGLALGSGDLGVVNVDSHLDVRDLSAGTTSGTPFFRALTALPGEMLRGRNFVEYAVQEQHNSPYYHRWVRERGASVMTFRDVAGRPLETFLEALRTAGEGVRAVAVSVDIDAARNNDAPGASASNPSGLAALDLHKIARAAGRTERVRMLDLMETCPPLDQDGRTAALGASVLFWFLKGLSERR